MFFSRRTSFPFKYGKAIFWRSWRPQRQNFLLGDTDLSKLVNLCQVIKNSLTSTPVIERTETPRPNNRLVVGMWRFKDTPQIHLISLPALNNRWTCSVTIGQVSLPYKQNFLTYMLKTFPLSLGRIARLVGIGNNSRNSFHEETIRVETASEPPHWPTNHQDISRWVQHENCHSRC